MNNKGFGILEVLIASLISSLIFLAISGFTEITEKQMRTSKSMGEWSSIINTLTRVLTDDVVCLGVIQRDDQGNPAILNLTESENKLPDEEPDFITNIHRIALDNQIIVKKNQKLGSFKISSLNLKILRELQPTTLNKRYLVRFNIKASVPKGTTKALGVQDRKFNHVFAISTNKLNNEIIGCSNLQNSKYSQFQTYLTPGEYTWIVPPGTKKILVELWGAGGGGAAGAYNGVKLTAGGGSGGSGEYMKTFLDVEPGNTIKISVGRGGEYGLGESAGDTDRPMASFPESGLMGENTKVENSDTGEVLLTYGGDCGKAPVVLPTFRIPDLCKDWQGNNIWGKKYKVDQIDNKADKIDNRWGQYGCAGGEEIKHAYTGLPHSKNKIDVTRHIPVFKCSDRRKEESQVGLFPGSRGNVGAYVRNDRGSARGGRGAVAAKGGGAGISPGGGGSGGTADRPDNPKYPGEAGGNGRVIIWW